LVAELSRKKKYIKQRREKIISATIQSTHAKNQRSQEGPKIVVLKQ